REQEDCEQNCAGAREARDLRQDETGPRECYENPARRDGEVGQVQTESLSAHCQPILFNREIGSCQSLRRHIDTVRKRVEPVRDRIRASTDAAESGAVAVTMTVVQLVVAGS